MKFLLQAVAISFALVAPVFAQFDLSTYVRVARYALPDLSNTLAPSGTPLSNYLAQEASGVAYNWDTDTLFVIGDGGRSITQVSKTGQLIDTMTLALDAGKPQGTAFYDPEGITYIGGNQFVFTEERLRVANLVTYAAGTTLAYSGAQQVKLGTTIGNVGLEGLSFDPATGGYIFVKESGPIGVFQTTINFALGTASNGSATTVNSVNLFNPTLLGLSDTADVYALSNFLTNSSADYNNLLVIGQENGRIVETDRAGNILSSLQLVTDPSDTLNIADIQNEGITVGADGTLYIVNENGGGSITNPQLWVYKSVPEPSTYVLVGLAGAFAVGSWLRRRTLRRQA